MTKIDSTESNHKTFGNVGLEEQIMTDENRPFFLERSESGLITNVATEVNDVEVQRESPYAFHYINENLELHHDLFIIDNDDDEDDGNLRNQIKGNKI